MADQRYYNPTTKQWENFEGLGGSGQVTIRDTAQSGTTAQRDAAYPSPQGGEVWDNTDKGYREFYNGATGAWEKDQQIIGGAAVVTVSPPAASKTRLFGAFAAGDVVTRGSAASVTAASLPRIEGADIPTNSRRLSIKATASSDSSVTDWLVVLNAADELTAKPTFDDALDTAAAGEILRYGTTMSTSNSTPVITIGQNDDVEVVLDTDITSVFVVPVSAGAFAGEALLNMKIQEAA